MSSTYINQSRTEKRGTFLLLPVQCSGPLVPLTGRDSVTRRALRPTHRPDVSLNRSHLGRGRLDIANLYPVVPMWLRAAYSEATPIIVRNTAVVVRFPGGNSSGHSMGFSAQLVPCCRTKTFADGRTDKAYWLLIYTEPGTGRWCEEFFRRKIEAEAAQMALYARWSNW